MGRGSGGGLDRDCGDFPLEGIAGLDLRETDMEKRKDKVLRINREWCKGCGICVEFCPRKVLCLDERDKAVVARPGDCAGCGLCEGRCPDLAIQICAGVESST